MESPTLSLLSARWLQSVGKLLGLLEREWAVFFGKEVKPAGRV